MILRCLRGRKTRLASVATLLAVVAMLGAVLLLSAPAQAQFDDNAPPPNDGGGAAAPAPAAGGGNAGAGNTAPPADTQTTLEWVYEALGLTYSIVFLGLSFTFVALLVMNILTVRRDNVVPLQLVEAFEAQLNEKRYQKEYEMAKTDE